MDIGMNTPDGDFSLRVSALIINNDQLLVIKHDNYDCFYTIGGGVNLNETSTDAVIREILEETGYLLPVDRLVFIQERFYNINSARHHEIVFFYLMKSTDVQIENGTCTDHQEEKLYWLPIDELQNTNLVPEFLRTSLTSIPEEVIHIISKE
ncbi:MAG: NUDIX domain-containing protein [Oscillospiraceae bacterium]|nr:NUDIX domain-containing protein [Oscillospiraceae bacterium]